jgi:hypothetical protein
MMPPTPYGGAGNAGVPDFAILPWVAMFAPGKTPPEIVERLSREMAVAMKRAAGRARGSGPRGVQLRELDAPGAGRIPQGATQGVGTVAREAGLQAR